jgi:D-alanyl-lipoteichoic acid acyltransferase DltB (MBOAT superfamily)
MMPQFASVQARTVNWQNIHTGICMLSIGLFKKVILADSLAPTVNEGFNSTELLPFHQAWLTSLSYSLQLYFDFSGYTDMAIGSALLCNIRLPANFNSPYQATDIQDFWRRWHITLSRWLRDYLYIPLGGNRHGLVHSYTALIMTFLLGGLWHGASWTFVFWGALHGAASVIHKGWQTTGWKLPAFPSWLLTFLFINFAWVFFRADTFSGALGILESMAGLHGFAPSADLLAIIENVFTVNTWNPFLDGWWGRRLLLVCFSMLIALLLPNSSVFAEKSLLSLNKSVSAVLLGIFSGSVIFYTLFMIAGINSFIYFYF